MNSRQRFLGVSSTGLPLSSLLGLNSLRPNFSVTSLRKLSGHSGSSGSGMREAKTTARHAPNGRLAHQMCSVEMWPCRIDFSRADCSETSFSGRATSMRRFMRIQPRIARMTRMKKNKSADDAFPIQAGVFEIREQGQSQAGDVQVA